MRVLAPKENNFFPMGMQISWNACGYACDNIKMELEKITYMIGVWAEIKLIKIES